MYMCRDDSFKKFLFIFIFGCAGSLLLCTASCSEQGLLSCCSAWASHCGGLSCGAQASGA